MTFELGIQIYHLVKYGYLVQKLSLRRTGQNPMRSGPGHDGAGRTYGEGALVVDSTTAAAVR